MAVHRLADGLVEIARREEEIIDMEGEVADRDRCVGGGWHGNGRQQGEPLEQHIGRPQQRVRVPEVERRP